MKSHERMMTLKEVVAVSDAKSLYLEASRYYIEVDAHQSAIDAKRYAKSRAREKRYGDNWKKHTVDLNDVVQRFAPDGNTYQDGVKLVFEGAHYVIKTDMASGYLRIYDKNSRSYVLLDGTPCGDNDLTHFKIN